MPEGGVLAAGAVARCMPALGGRAAVGPAPARREVEARDLGAVERHAVQERVRLRASIWPPPVSFNALLDGCARPRPRPDATWPSAPEPDLQEDCPRARPVVPAPTAVPQLADQRSWA